MRLLLTITAVVEAATGLALMATPGVVVALLLGGELSGPGVAVGRVAGFALLALGVSCWPGRKSAEGSVPALRAMLIYNALVTVFLVYFGISNASVGVLLWPAVVLHAVFTAWCAALVVRG